MSYFDFKGGVYYDIRKYILDENQEEFTAARVKEEFPDLLKAPLKGC